MKTFINKLLVVAGTCLVLGELYAQVGSIEIYSSCAFINNGSISIDLDSAELTTYSLPFVLEWENLSNGEFGENIIVDNYLIEIQDLYAGEYEFIIALGKGCQISIDTTIEETETNTLMIRPRLYHPTCGLKNGLISVQASGGTSPYIYTWNKIQNENYINKLGPGEYCITVTDQNCGYAEKCMTLEEKTPKVKVMSINQISSCEPLNNNSCDGQIVISVDNVDNYSVSWINSEGDTIGSQNTLSSLCNPGSYLISISFSESCQPWVYEVFVGCCNDESSDLAVYLDPIPGCGDPNELTAIVSGGVQPYFYQWNTLQSSANITNLGNNNYIVTVTDSIGCSVIDSFDFHFVDEISRIEPCKDLQDGEITFQITNSNNCPVTITYDFSICSDCTFLPVIEADTHSIIELTLTQLGGNIDYTYYINICGCNIPFKFKLNEDEWEKTYAGFDDIGDWTFLCIYDIDCKENQVDSGQVELAYVDLNSESVDCEGLDKDCGEIEYECENTVIKTRKIKAKNMRRERAVQLAQTLMYDPGLIAGTTNNGNPCDWITVCPNDPTCIHAEFHYGGDFKYYEYLGNNCWRVKCKIGFVSTSYTICGLEYVPEYLYNYYDPTFSLNINLDGNNCNAVEKNVGQLAMFVDEYVAYNPDFYGTDLHTYLLIHMADPRRWCAKVRFCTSNFEIVWDNIDEVECETIDPPLSLGGFVGDITETCKPYVDAKGDLRVFCSNLCNSNRPEIYCPPQPVLIEEDFRPTIMTLTGSDPVNMMTRYDSPTAFSRFILNKQNDSLTTVSGVYESSDELLFSAFHPDKWSPFNLDNIEYLYQHFDSSFVVGVTKDTTIDATFDIIALSEDTLLRKGLESSYLLNLSKIWSKDSFHVITGNFSGNLNFDSTVISSSLSQSYFITQLDNELDQIVFHKITQNGWKICTDEQSGNLAVWSPSTTSLYVDNSLKSGISSGEIITMDALQDSIQIRDINLVLQSNLKLLDYKRGNSSSSYILAGNGRIVLNGSQIYNTSTSKVIILNLAHNGSVNYVKDFALSSVDTSFVTIENGSNNITYYVVNTTDDITIGDSLVSNLGGTDIVVFSIDDTGNFDNLYVYNSSSNEMVMDVFYSNEFLFMGGELDEDTYSRKIGEIQFENYSNEYKQAFTSYIALSMDTSSLDSIAEGLEIRSQSNSQTPDIGLITVHPNPANNVLFVQIPGFCVNNRIYIKDFSGKTCYTRLINGLHTGTTFEVSLEQISSGVYYVVSESNCNFALSKPFIVIK